MRILRTFFYTSILMLSAAACNKIETATAGLPDIRFGMHISEPEGTKALLESDDLLTNGTEVQVYGLAGTTPIQGHTTTAGTTYLNQGQTIQYSSSSAGWSFTGNNGEAYQWNNTLSYKFFGWLTKDAKSSLTATGFFGSGFSFNTTTNVLSVPSKTMGISAGNFDFAYSDIVARTAGEADYSTVEMSLNHLFASFGLSAVNYSSKQLTIKSIILHGLVDGKSATINYNGTSPVVTYNGGSVSSTPATLNGAAFNLAAAGSTGDSKASVVGTPGTSPVYFLVWPQTNTEMSYGGTTDSDGRPAPVAADKDEPYLEINYTQEGSDFTAYAAIPHDSDGWAPGVRHEMELSFQDKEIDLTFKAAKWDKMEPVIDYDGAVSVNTKLHLPTEFFNNCTYSSTFSTDKTVYFKPGVPIILEFAIATPENATWIVGKKLDWDTFDVYNYPDGARTDPDEIITAEGLVDGNSVRIAIDPPTKDLQKTEFSLELSFSVRLNNGEMVSIEDDDIFADDCPRKFVYIKQ